MQTSSASRQPPVRAVILDLDGVLVDTARYHFRAWKRIADELGIAFTEKDNEQLKGVSRLESLERLLAMGEQDMAEAEKQQWTDRKNGYYREYLKDLGEEEILPGAIELLEALRGAEVKTAVASASKNGPTIVERLSLSGYFDAAVFGQDLQHSKPHPQVFVIAAERLAEAPSQCVVVEDGNVGVEAAHRAGMRCVGVGDDQHLKAADLVVANLAGLAVSDLLGLQAKTTEPTKAG